MAFRLRSSCSKKVYDEFVEYLRTYEATNGTQPIENIRTLARNFAGTKSPVNNKVAQRFYYIFFASICVDRGYEFPVDFNFDNPYDPDSLYPDDKEIKMKLKRDDREIRRTVLKLIEERDD